MSYKQRGFGIIELFWIVFLIIGFSMLVQLIINSRINKDVTVQTVMVILFFIISTSVVVDIFKRLINYFKQSDWGF